MATPSIAKALRMHRLVRARQVTHLVGERIRPEELLESDVYPAIVYGIVTSDPQHDLQGSSGAAFTRVQFNCYGNTLDEADAVADAVEDVLDGFSGWLGEEPEGGADDERLWVDDCTLQNRYSRKTGARQGEGRGRVYVVVDFLVSHSKPLPSLTLE